MKIRYAPQKNRKGFTLIEIMIAILLLVVALVGFASVTVSVIKGNDLGRMVTSATTLAKDKLEEIKNATATRTGYDALSSGTISETVESIYTRQWTVGAVRDTAPENDLTKMKKISVTVTWTWNGQSHNVTLNTIISRPSQ